MKKQVADSTRSRYLDKQVRFVTLLYQFWGPDSEEAAGLVNAAFFDEFRRLVPGSDVWRLRVREKLSLYDPNEKPFDLSRLTAKLVARVILKHMDGNVLSMSTVGGWTSAVADFFRSYNVPTPAGYKEDVKKFVNGYNRTNERENNVVGKDALPFEVLCKMSRALLACAANDAVFAHLFLLLQWNLICRSNNVEKIDLEHLQWREDCLLVYFRKQKNDQDGSRSMDPRSVYANPTKPEVCTVLALGIYLLVFSPVGDDRKLFVGDSQSARFSKCLSKILKGDLRDEIAALGFDPSDFGSQSIRKGGASFVSSGTTDSPAQVSICLRAGWTLPKIEKTYFRQEKAGDQFIGRTVAGLPIYEPEFAVLPPLWDEKNAESVLACKQVMEVCFKWDALPVSLQAVCRNAVASVVYHVTWLREKLPSSHSLFSTRLFSLFSVDELKKHIICGLPTKDGDLRATGVPAHVHLKLRLAEIERKQDDMLTCISSFSASLESTLRDGLNDFALSQGHMTYDKFEELLQGHVEVLKQQLRLSINTSTLDKEKDAVGVGSVQAHPGHALHMWDGMLHLVPQDFEFPSVTVRQAFMLWACGSLEKNLPAFRFLTPRDMPSVNMRKRLSDFCAIMRPLENAAKAATSPVWPKDSHGKWKASLTAAEASSVFEAVEDVVSIPDETGKGRLRRGSQLLWSSHQKAFAKHVKQSKEKSVKKSASSRSRKQSRSKTKQDCGSAAKLNPASKKKAKAVAREHEFSDIDAAVSVLTDYALNQLGLIEDEPVKGDGACMFRVASRQLERARPELGKVRHSIIREKCVAWGYRNYRAEDVDVLQDLGYENWEHWRDEMSSQSHYGDEICMEAIAAVYEVRICIIFVHRCASHRFIGDEIHPVLYMGCLADHHFYSFVPAD